MLELPPDHLNLIMNECGFISLGKLSQVCHQLNRFVNKSPLWKRELNAHRIKPIPNLEKDQVIDLYRKYFQVNAEFLGNNIPKNIFESKIFFLEHIDQIQRSLIDRMRDKNKKDFSKIEQEALRLILSEGGGFPNTIILTTTCDYSQIKNLMTIAVEKRFSFEILKNLIHKKYLVNATTIEKALENSDKKTVELLIDHMQGVDERDLKELIDVAYRTNASYKILERLNRYLLELM